MNVLNVVRNASFVLISVFGLMAPGLASAQPAFPPEQDQRYTDTVTAVVGFRALAAENKGTAIGGNFHFLATVLEASFVSEVGEFVADFYFQRIGAERTGGNNGTRTATTLPSEPSTDCEACRNGSVGTAR